MAKSRKDYIKIRLNGKTLVAIALYSALMRWLGACVRACGDVKDTTTVKTANVRTR